MTMDNFRSIVLAMGNQGWCRHWTHWNDGTDIPWLMVISVHDSYGKDSQGRYLEKGLMERGFRKEVWAGRVYWVIERTNPDGTPYK
jgi:adenosylcobinamide amidohydrolase